MGIVIDEGVTPLPERGEERLPDAGPRDLSARDYRAVVARGAKATFRDAMPDAAAAVAYYAFTALPALLLVAVGVFALAGGEDAIREVVERVGTVAPAEVQTLVGDALRRTTREDGGLALVIAGGALALWTATGAMGALMRALTRAWDRDERRGFVRRRLTALAMLLFAGAAFLLTFGLLVLGPELSGWVGDATGLEDEMQWIWWAGQWPVLIGALLVVFAALLHLGPDVDHPRGSLVTVGAVMAVAVWLATSALFALYVANFGSYNATWGSLAAVVIMLTWLWLSALALLFGAEVNAEAERSRELRRGEPADDAIRAPGRGAIVTPQTAAKGRRGRGGAGARGR